MTLNDNPPEDVDRLGFQGICDVNAFITAPFYDKLYTKSYMAWLHSLPLISENCSKTWLHTPIFRFIPPKFCTDISKNDNYIIVVLKNWVSLFYHRNELTPRLSPKKIMKILLCWQNSKFELKALHIKLYANLVTGKSHRC